MKHHVKRPPKKRICMRHGTRNRHRRYTPNAAKHKAKLTQSRSKSCEAEDRRKEDETVDIACEKGSTAVTPIRPAVQCEPIDA